MLRGVDCKGYQVWGRLSQGGMSHVWLARHKELALPVVMKTLFPSGEETFDARYKRLLQEARLTARLTSPRVVRVIDVGVYTPPDAGVESLPFLVEEYVDGIDLSEFDRRRRNALQRPLPLWAVADQIAQAAEGLHAAHQAGVIHCDVKPSNLFGHGHAHIKVGDFGVAVGTSAAHHGPPAGTPLYMAPEHLLGERIDRRADVYSLGTTAFALRYGRTPFETPSDALRQDVAPAFPPARSPEEAYFQHVVARMMARRADARYDTMMTARHHLRALARSTTPRLAPLRVGPATFELGSARVTFEVGDLARVETDAIVNSAQSSMVMSSSLGMALRARGGEAIEREAVAGGERALGECVATGAGALAARGVLHAVGGWHEVSCVARATHRALLLAEERGFTRVAMPAIATNSGGVTVESCADAMVGALRLHLALGGSRIREVRFVLYDEAIYKRFVEVAVGLLLGAEDAFLFDDEHDAPASDPASTSAPTLFASAGSPRAPAATRSATEELSAVGPQRREPAR